MLGLRFRQQYVIIQGIKRNLYIAVGDVMLENVFLRRLLYTNTLIVICVIFTVATVLDLTITVISFGDVGTTYTHLGSRLILCIFGAISLLVFRYFKKCPFALILCIHFLLILFFAVIYIKISGIFIEQHPRAMFYMIRSVLIIYPVIAVSCIIIDRILNTRRNKRTK